MGFVGYIRVSRTDGREGDSFQSPDEQRSRIEGWARSHGMTVADSDWFIDLDESGGTLVRPELEKALARITAGKAEGIAVAKLDRLSRAGVADALKLVEQIHADGGEIAAVDLGIDPKSDFGEFAMTLMLALARMERRRITTSWESARTNAVARGAFVGPTPLGFKRTKISSKTGKPAGEIVMDETAGPLVRRMFEISGEAGLEIALEYGRKTWPDRFWSPTQLRKILASRVYRGDLRSGPNIIAREAIEPLVSEDVWYAAQHEPPPPRTDRQKYPLSGIAKCANCGGSLTGHYAGKAGSKRRGYRCNGKGCNKRPHVYADQLEALVVERVQGTAHRWVGPREGELDELDAARRAAQADLENYVVSVKIADAELWQKGMDARQEAFAKAQQQYVAAREADVEMPDLNDPTPEDFGRMIESLTVSQGRGVALAERVTLALAGD